MQRKWKRLSAIATTQVSLEEGTLVRIIIGVKGSAGNFIDVYSGKDVNAPRISRIDSTTLFGAVEFHTEFHGGLTIDINTGGAADITVVWDS